MLRLCCRFLLLSASRALCYGGLLLRLCCRFLLLSASRALCYGGLLLRLCCRFLLLSASRALCYGGLLLRLCCRFLLLSASRALCYGGLKQVKRIVYYCCVGSFVRWLSDLFSFCSIEFDRDCDFFAIAGVTKKIKVRGCNVL